jgi:hypothetical protein
MSIDNFQLHSLELFQVNLRDSGNIEQGTIAGTQNRITVNGGIEPVSISGPLVLSCPQDIATTSNVQFAKLGLGINPDPSHALTVVGSSIFSENCAIGAYNSDSLLSINAPLTVSDNDINTVLIDNNNTLDTDNSINKLAVLGSATKNTGNSGYLRGMLIGPSNSSGSFQGKLGLQIDPDWNCSLLCLGGACFGDFKENVTVLEGRVGIASKLSIGTTSPTYTNTLDVYGTTGFSDKVNIISNLSVGTNNPTYTNTLDVYGIGSFSTGVRIGTNNVVSSLVCDGGACFGLTGTVATGYVGIASKLSVGTTNPTYTNELEVIGIGRFSTGVRIGTNNIVSSLVCDGGACFGLTGTVATGHVGIASKLSVGTGTPAYNNTLDITGIATFSDKVSINSNLSIGTGSPVYTNTLDVYGIGSFSTGVRIGTNNVVSSLVCDGGACFGLTGTVATGYVGIASKLSVGTTNPTYTNELEVIGIGRFSTGVRIGTNNIVSSLVCDGGACFGLTGTVATGYVGIASRLSVGTGTPSYNNALDVTGIGRFSTGIYLGSTGSVLNKYIENTTTLSATFATGTSNMTIKYIIIGKTASVTFPEFLINFAGSTGPSSNINVSNYPSELIPTTAGTGWFPIPTTFTDNTGYIHRNIGYVTIISPSTQITISYGPYSGLTPVVDTTLFPRVFPEGGSDITTNCGILESTISYNLF